MNHKQCRYEFQRLDSQRLTWKGVGEGALNWGSVGDKVMKNISILQIKSACQRGNPKTYFLTLVDRAQDEGRSTRSGPPLPAAAAVAVRWLLFWQPGIFQFGTQDDGARSLCKFISSFLTQQHYQAQDWRPPTSDLQPPATTMMMPMMEMLHLCTRTYICMYIHTYLLTCWPAAWLCARTQLLSASVGICIITIITSMCTASLCSGCFTCVCLFAVGSQLLHSSPARRIRN